MCVRVCVRVYVCVCARIWARMRVRDRVRAGVRACVLNDIIIMEIMCRSLMATLAASPYRIHEEANVPRPLGGCAPAA